MDSKDDREGEKQSTPSGYFVFLFWFYLDKHTYQSKTSILLFVWFLTISKVAFREVLMGLHCLNDSTVYYMRVVPKTAYTLVIRLLFKTAETNAH